MPDNPVQINLLGESDLEHTPIGRIITWATTYGRYIMIGTEIVVLLAFISRFSLDRKLTDLNDEISQKQTIITVNSDLEDQINVLQGQLTKIRSTIKDQNIPLTLLDSFQNLLPPDVYLTAFDFANNQLKLNAIAGTTTGFSQFINLLTNNNNFKQIELGQVTKDISGINFQISAAMASALPVPTVRPAP